MSERIKQRLGVESSKNSVNSDTFIKINLEGEQRLLPPDEINKVVNIGDRFDIERHKSTFFRILGTINPTISNALFNLNNPQTSNLYTWAGFNDMIFLDTSYPKDNDVADNTDNTYSTAIKQYLKEKDGWFGYIDPDISKKGLCNFIDMEPRRERFSFTSDINPFNAYSGQQPVKNWELTITYPASSDKNHLMVSNGLLIATAISCVVSNRIMTAIGMPCLHNLNVGDLVRVDGSIGYDGDHVVISLGLENGDLKGYYFVIDVPPTGSISLSSRIKKLFGGVESEYYFRKFKKIKTRNSLVIEQDDYESYRLAFSENVYTDVISQFVFNEDIDISELKDNLGRPLSELYLTIIKTDSNNLFGSVSSGIETPFIPILTTSSPYHRIIPTINRIHNGGTLPFTSSNALETNININYNDFYGDIVEYNKNEVKETILAHVSHRFNTVNRENNPSIQASSSLGLTPTYSSTLLGPRQEGYFYTPHSLIKIREFSSYVETGDIHTEGVPDYAVNLGDGRYLWRDLLDIGFNESSEKTLDYPFLNGCHYMYDNYCFHVRRQDPFDDWGLFWNTFPSDPIGERTTDKFTTNSSDEIC